MMPQSQWFGEEGPLFAVSEWMRHEERNDCVAQTFESLKWLGAGQSCPLIFCGNFINLSVALRSKQKQRMQMKP